MSGAKDERARAEATPTAVFPDLDAAPSESSSACMAALSSKSHPSSQPSHESSIASPLSPSDSIRASGKRDKLALSLHDSIIRGGLLRDSIFPEWKDGGPRSNMESPDEMMKKDPLTTQIWKLYSRTKSQLPNQERMENLTWRMMAMSLKRIQREQQARYVSSPAPLPGSTLAVSCYLSLISLSLSPPRPAPASTPEPVLLTRFRSSVSLRRRRIMMTKIIIARTTRIRAVSPSFASQSTSLRRPPRQRRIL